MCQKHCYLIVYFPTRSHGRKDGCVVADIERSHHRCYVRTNVPGEQRNEFSTYHCPMFSLLTRDAIKSRCAPPTPIFWRGCGSFDSAWYLRGDSFVSRRPDRINCIIMGQKKKKKSRIFGILCMVRYRFSLLNLKYVAIVSVKQDWDFSINRVMSLADFRIGWFRRVRKNRRKRLFKRLTTIDRTSHDFK